MPRVPSARLTTVGGPARPWLYPTLPQPCRLQVGPRFASRVWLYHCASSPSRRLLHVTVPQARPTYGRRARRSHKAYGRPPHSHSPVAYRWAHRSPPAHARATLPALLLVGGPAGRLPHMAVLHVRYASPGGPGGCAPRVAWTHDGTPRLRFPVGPSAAYCTRLSRRPTASCRWAPGSLIYWQYPCTPCSHRPAGRLPILYLRISAEHHLSTGYPPGLLPYCRYVLSASAANHK